jgi:hypothetical protein
VWADIFEAKTVNDKFEYFMNVFLKHFNINFPLKTIKSEPDNKRNRNRWFKEELAEMSKKVKCAYLEIIRSNYSTKAKIEYVEQ